MRGELVLLRVRWDAISLRPISRYFRPSINLFAPSRRPSAQTWPVLLIYKTLSRNRSYKAVSPVPHFNDCFFQSTRDEFLLDEDIKMNTYNAV